MAGGTRYNFLAVFFVALGSFTYGFNSAIMGLVIGLPAFFQYFHISLNDTNGNQITGATNGLYSGGGIIGCALVPWLLDRLGRTRIMLIGLIGCACSLICFTAMVATFGGTDNRVGNGMGVFFLFLFVFFYGGCMGATSYVYCTELFPTNLRAQGAGFSVGGLFTATLIYTQTAPVAFADVGWKFYILFIILPLIGAGLMWHFFPETKLLSLEEIGRLFGDYVAMDIRQLTPRGREALDRELAVVGFPADEIAREVNGASTSPPGDKGIISESHLEKV
ncbi:hypothetical protein LTR84_008260 [Exophiala bonariae]|uniref:Major facilitator superfamily (MFS) profile domain-containing protein n=1 Tax=Exophiala bonariae TaxID=1690606 RepID=A0AAV9MYT6_9EURO|nr:hypothetical protein LTR84_008260 [Exophiala bonariae]